MSTALSRRLALASVEETTAMIHSGQIPLEDFGQALTIMPPQAARERLQALPVPVQSSTMRLTIGAASEAPLLELMTSRVASTSVMLDVSMFEITSLAVDMMRGGEGADANEVKEERGRRTVVIIDPKGTRRVVPVYLNPERAWVYFQSIARNPNKKWQNHVLRRLGLPFLGFLHACIDEGKLDVEIDDWTQCLEDIDDDYRDDAIQLGRTHTADDLENDLIDRHAGAMRRAFRLPDDFMKKPEMAAAKADDLVSDLDLG